MKQIKKSTLDELIRLERKYYRTHDTDILPGTHSKGFDLSNQAFGRDLSWIKFTDLVSAIVGGPSALKPHATNADIYAIFGILGFEVVDDTPGREVAP